MDTRIAIVIAVVASLILNGAFNYFHDRRQNRRLEEATGRAAWNATVESMLRLKRWHQLLALVMDTESEVYGNRLPKLPAAKDIKFVTGKGCARLICECRGVTVRYDILQFTTKVLWKDESAGVGYNDVSVEFDMDTDFPPHKRAELVDFFLYKKRATKTKRAISA